MKYWRGYLVAAILAGLTYAFKAFAETHAVVVDMVYPYLTRMVQGILAEWSSSASFCLWQSALLLAVAVFLTTVVLMIVFRWNPIQWGGWVISAVSLMYLIYTCIWGLNFYAGPISDDLFMKVTEEYTLTELESATRYYRDRANTLSIQVKRNADGSLDFGSFEKLAEGAGDGFHTLTYEEGYAIFAGSKVPVKKLGWSDFFTSKGVSGITVPFTGESAVNPQIPTVRLPFAICHEMAHRMSIAVDRDADFAAFLAAAYNQDVSFQYSAYFMAFRSCYNALYQHDPELAAKVMLDANSELKKDFADYDEAFGDKEAKKAAAEQDPDKVNTLSSGDVCDLLVNWHLGIVAEQTVVEEPENSFNPLDKTQVDLSGIVNAE